MSAEVTTRRNGQSIVSSLLLHAGLLALAFAVLPRAEFQGSSLGSAGVRIWLDAGRSKAARTSEAPAVKGSAKTQPGFPVPMSSEAKRAVDPGQGTSGQGTGALPEATADFLVTQMPKVKKELRLPYPESARREKVQGPVVMELLIDDQGAVRDASLVKGPSADLSKLALEAVREFRFDPAKVGEKPVSVKVRFVYRFVLDT